MTVGYIEGGKGANVIPETVKFGGSYRSLSAEGLSYTQERIKEVKYIYKSLFCAINNFLLLLSYPHFQQLRSFTFSVFNIAGNTC